MAKNKGFLYRKIHKLAIIPAEISAGIIALIVTRLFSCSHKKRVK
jgi:hypothetical protein